MISFQIDQDVKRNL